MSFLVIEPIKRVYVYNGCMHIVFKDTPFTLGSLTDIPRTVKRVEVS